MLTKDEVKNSCDKTCFLEWVEDGDRRLICKKHNRYFVIDNGSFREIKP